MFRRAESGETVGITRPGAPVAETVIRTVEDDPKPPIRFPNLGFVPLAITRGRAAAAGASPPIHGDPFDRLPIARAQVEILPMTTPDMNILRRDAEARRRLRSAARSSP